MGGIKVRPLGNSTDIAIVRDGEGKTGVLGQSAEVDTQRRKRRFLSQPELGIDADINNYAWRARLSSSRRRSWTHLVR